MSVDKGHSHFGVGALAYSLEADRDHIRVHRGFLMQGQPTHFSIIVKGDRLTSIPFTEITLPSESEISPLTEEYSKAIEPSAFYGFPKKVPTDLASYDLSSIIIGCGIRPNKKFRQDVADVGRVPIDDNIVKKYPSNVSLRIEDQIVEPIRQDYSNVPYDETDDPFFYYLDGPDTAHFGIKNSVVLAENLVLISESGRLKICDHEDTDKLTRSVQADELEIGSFERSPVKSSTKKKSYDYIKYCDNCDQIIELI